MLSLLKKNRRELRKRERAKRSILMTLRSSNLLLFTTMMRDIF
jgi:hypothetical protein